MDLVVSVDFSSSVMKNIMISPPKTNGACLVEYLSSDMRSCLSKRYIFVFRLIPCLSVVKTNSFNNRLGRVGCPKGGLTSLDLSILSLELPSKLTSSHNKRCRDKCPTYAFSAKQAQLVHRQYSHSKQTFNEKKITYLYVFCSLPPTRSRLLST